MIENPQVIRFSNERARVFADMLSSTYWMAKELIANYYADPELGNTLIANMGEALDDGATQDGRPIVTGNDLLGIVTRASDLVDDLEADNNAKLNTILAVAVNGNRRF